MSVAGDSDNEVCADNLDPIGMLRCLLREDIKRFDTESTKHKHIFRRTELVVIVTTSLTTIVAGLGLLVVGSEREIQFAVLALSAIGTAVTSWAASRRARDLWQHEREVYYALKDIEREVKFRDSSDQLSLKEVKELFARANAILGSSTAKWARITERKREQSVPPDERRPDPPVHDAPGDPGRG